MTKKLKPGESVKGMIPVVDFTGPDLKPSEPKLIPWQEAARQGPLGNTHWNPELEKETVAVPQDMVDRMHTGLPDPVRRSARQRYEALVLKLMNYARACVKEYGHTSWPMSMQRILDEKGVKAKATPEQQVFALAEHFIVKAENRQRESDSHKVVSDWHGHFD
jgi:hypothetical protein